LPSSSRATDTTDVLSRVLQRRRIARAALRPRSGRLYLIPGEQLDKRMEGQVVTMKIKVRLKLDQERAAYLQALASDSKLTLPDLLIRLVDFAIITLEVGDLTLDSETTMPPLRAMSESARPSTLGSKTCAG
jgi:hypothetical protein